MTSSRPACGKEIHSFRVDVLARGKLPWKERQRHHEPNAQSNLLGGTGAVELLIYARDEMKVKEEVEEEEETGKGRSAVIRRQTLTRR
eukprot:3222057-Rhodomonas_salina.3